LGERGFGDHSDPGSKEINEKNWETVDSMIIAGRDRIK